MHYVQNLETVQCKERNTLKFIYDPRTSSSSAANRKTTTSTVLTNTTQPSQNQMATASSGEHNAAAVMRPPAQRTLCESHNMSTKLMTSLSVLFHHITSTKHLHW